MVVITFFGDFWNFSNLTKVIILKALVSREPDETWGRGGGFILCVQYFFASILSRSLQGHSVHLEIDRKRMGPGGIYVVDICTIIQVFTSDVHDVGRLLWADSESMHFNIYS